MKKNLNIFRVFAFYPLLLPIWKEAYFRKDNVSFSVPIHMSDEILLEQKKFFLSAPDPTIRSRILMSLAECDNSNFGPVLEEFLLKENNPEVLSDILRIMHEKALRYSNTKILLELMKSELPSSRAYAACIYLDLPDSKTEVFEMLSKENTRFVSNMVWGKIYEKRTFFSESDLISLYPKTPKFQLSRLLKTLAAISAIPEENAILMQFVDKGSLEDRISIAESIGQRKDCADAVLAKFAKDPDQRLRMAVARSLLSPGRLEFLCQLSQDMDSEVRRLSVISLAGDGVDNDTALLAIIARLADEEEVVRSQSENALVSVGIGDKYLNLIWKEYLSKPASEASAIKVLGELKFVAAAEDIRRIMKARGDVLTVSRSLTALGKMNHKVSVKDCAYFADSKFPEIRRATAFSLGCLAERDGFDGLAKLAMDKAPEVSAEALSGIWKIGDDFFSGTVIACLKRTGDSYLIRSAAASAASAMPASKDFVKALRRICVEKTIIVDNGKEFDVDQVRASAVWSLAEIARKDSGFQKDARDVIAVLRSNSSKEEDQKVSSSEFLSESARQAEAFLDGKDCQASEISPAKPNLVINSI